MRDKLSDDLATNAKQLQMIHPLPRRTFVFPLRGLRVWLFSLLALIGLPVGFMLILVGTNMAEDLSGSWEQVTATVRLNDDISIEYAYDGGNGEIVYELDQFASVPQVGEFQLVATLCDLTGWLTIPSERGATFPVWVNPAKPTQQSCVPISRDMGALYLTVGIFAVFLSGIRLLRTIGSAAANNPKRR